MVSSGWWYSQPQFKHLAVAHRRAYRKHCMQVATKDSSQCPNSKLSSPHHRQRSTVAHPACLLSTISFTQYQVSTSMREDSTVIQGCLVASSALTTVVAVHFSVLPGRHKLLLYNESSLLFILTLRFTL